MKVLILTQWYQPEPAILMQELAQSLQALGHEVTVFTGFPNYPSGKLYPGYRQRLWQRETLGGVPVVRVPLYANHNRSGLQRALNYLSFAISSALLGPLLISRPDIIFVYHPPLTVGFPAYLLSRIWRVPFVLQVQDLWPETLAATEMLNNERILKWIGRYALWIYTKARSIVVISPGFRENLLSKGVPASKVDVVSNWIDSSIYYPAQPDPELAQELGLSGRFNVMFAGNIGEAQGLDSVIQAAILLKGDPAIQFVFVGDGIALPHLQKMVREYDLPNVVFLGRFPVEDMSRLYALADILVVHLKNEPLFRITIPHKILAYLGVGKPILASVAGDAADLIKNTKSGFTCPPEDPEALAAAVSKMASMSVVEREEMGEHGLIAARTLYSRAVLTQEIEGILRHSV